MGGPLGRVALLLAGVLLIAGCGDASDPLVASSPGSAATGATESAAATGATPRKPDVSPVQLRIPAIQVSTPLVGLGLHEDGTVEVPTNPDRAGWYELGTVPGQPGSSVILGHLDSLDGPAVFAELATLRVGQDVEVGLSDGTTVTFRIRRIATFANADFPADLVYAGSRGQTTLNLVTCGGEYDPDLGGYQANVVVFTRRVAA
ncbi:sortase domain-containing protein [Nocardioides bigeumensis]|uniref:Class F sortase n=1 Tax=Nocardioides bigeumensis TaxID=433657 RepID=A0ABN2YKH4_9ACTN